MNLDAKHSEIQEVLKHILDLTKPEYVFLYNCKYDLEGELNSFKLCVICEFEDKRRIYANIFDVDCEVPFDVILYTKEQFKELKADEFSFVSRVCAKGQMLYGKE